MNNITFHDLRHTFASQMVVRGASLKQVQEILVHKTMTLRYARPSREHKKKAVNLLNGLTAFSGVADSSSHKMSHFADSPIPTTGQLLDDTGRDGGI